MNEDTVSRLTKSLMIGVSFFKPSRVGERNEFLPGELGVRSGAGLPATTLPAHPIFLFYPPLLFIELFLVNSPSAVFGLAAPVVFGFVWLNIPFG